MTESSIVSSASVSARECQQLHWVREALCRPLDLPVDEVPSAFWDQIGAMQQEKFYGMGAELELAGRPWRYVYVIQSGMLKLYRYTARGRICVHHVFKKGDVVWPALVASRSGRNVVGLGVVHRSHVARLPFTEFRQLLRQAGYWEAFALQLELELAEKAMIREARRQFLTPVDHYRKAREDFGPFAQGLPDNLVAQWIGICPETLSRLKKES